MSKLPPIIGLCGGIGAGKDTVAASLVNELDYAQLSFARALKEAVATMFPWVPRCHFFGTQEEKAQTLFLNCTTGEPWTGRRLLEVVGTDHMRTIMPDIWVQAAMEQVDRNPSTLWVVSDVRFPNEAEAIRQRGGVIWEVIRDSGPQETTGHSSDSAWREMPKHAVLIARSGDVAGLQRQARQCARSGGRIG